MSNWTPQQGYYELAAAVVAHTAEELRHGPRTKRLDAAAAVRAGGLERWVVMTAGDEHTSEAIMAELHRLAALVLAGRGRD